MKMKKLLMLAVATVTAASCLSMSAETTYINETSKVGTSSTAWHGNGTYNNYKVTPLGCPEVVMAEHYFENNNGKTPLSELTVNAKPVYQEITGLDNGTYKVEFYVTAHHAWIADWGIKADNDNVNAAYVIVGGVETTKNFTSRDNTGYTSTEPLTVVFDNLEVTDGKLEMGIKVLVAEQTNWYTIQIKSLQREATPEEALAAAKEAANEVLNSEDYANVTGQERTDLQNALNAADATVDSINAALNAFKSAKPAYDSYVSTKAFIDAEMENNYASDATTNALKAELAKAPNTAAEATEVVTSILPKYGPWAVSNSIAEKTGNALVTITNPDANDGMTGWTQSQGDGNGKIEVQSNTAEYPTLNGTPSITHYFDGGNWNGNDWTTDVNQTISNLPKGKYRLSTLARGSENTRFHWLYAGDRESVRVALPHVGTEVTSVEVPYGKGWGIRHIDFDHEGGDLKIGVWSNAQQNHQWVSYTHFTLVKLPDVQSGISNAVVEDVNAPVEYFDLKGIRVNADNLNKGIYIKRQGNKVTKIIK